MNKWILSDSDGFRLIRNTINREYEVYQIIPFGDTYIVSNLYIDLDCYLPDRDFEDYYLKPFGYNSISELSQLYSDNPDTTDQIIAECIAETDALDCRHVFTGTFEECETFVRAKTGFTDFAI